MLLPECVRLQGRETSYITKKPVGRYLDALLAQN